MVSASSLRKKFYALPLRGNSWGWQAGVGALLLATCAAGAWRAPAHGSAVISVVAMLTLLVWLWHAHLQKAGCPRMVGLAAAVLAAWELSYRVVPGGSGGLLAGGVFVYLVIWTFCAYEREPGLQPLATLAILISAGILATPTIAIACAVLGIGFFVRNRRRGIGGSLGFALLLFTPLMLCVGAIVLLAFLRAETLFARPLSATVQMVSHTGVRQLAAQTAADLLSMIKELLFPLAVLALRVGTRRAGAPDLALALVVLVVAALHATQWVPSDAVSIPVVSLGGAAALLTQAYSAKSQAAAG